MHKKKPAQLCVCTRFLSWWDVWKRLAMVEDSLAKIYSGKIVVIKIKIIDVK